MAPVYIPSHGRRSRSTPSSNLHFNSDSPRKRRKYVPGGPGGGGRWVEEESQAQTISITPRPHIERSRSRQSPATAVRPRRERPPDKPTYDSAADAAAAAVQVDGYKPREERGWEEFHPDLEIDIKLVAFSAAQVDGVVEEQMEPSSEFSSLPERGPRSNSVESPSITNQSSLLVTPLKRRPGRPPRRPESMLSGLGSPPAQKIIPIPAQNPRERLTLPKPSYRVVSTFGAFEADKKLQENYVDKTMKRVGYQEGETFERPKNLIRLDETLLDLDVESANRADSEKDALDFVGGAVLSQVEYDMDEQDEQWLETLNGFRREQEQVDAIKPAVFEVTMTTIEKEWHALERRIPKPNPKPPQTHRPRSSSSAAVNGEPANPGEEQDTKCVICDDGDCENTNAIVFCDGCDLAVHQECYGVPFIPEGQWLCRKCQQVGRGTPTCIFCPNTDGAFKLTTESRWAHLLCAIWIPEVSIGNQTFMEPVQEVAAVPKQRWRLMCYLCNQKMGACIQCGNKACYQAFHVTCARRARLFMKMKSTHGGSASLDASVLKAFCDKHVPEDWAREHDVETATVAAKNYYRHEMKGRRWADSQQSAMALISAQPVRPVETAVESITEEGANTTGTAAAAQRKKRLQAQQKNVWRLPSGAPVVPQLVTAAVEEMIARFNVRKRKEFVAEACKYWTLKREARRGAPLLKRLQLQMETFSTSEITRRDFVAMGAAGGPKLERRIQFAEQLEVEMAALRGICHQLKVREEIKLRDIGMLEGVIDTIYSPITPLLQPITRKAMKLAHPHISAEKGEENTDVGRVMFFQAFEAVEMKLNQRFYNSLQAFSTDVGHIFRLVAGLETVDDAVEAYNLMAVSSFRDESLTPEQKEIKKLAKRIAKAIQAPLEDAICKEAELIHAKPFEKELRHIDSTWDSVTMQLSKRSTLLSANVTLSGGKGLASLAESNHNASVIGADLVENEFNNALPLGNDKEQFWQESPVSKPSSDIDTQSVPHPSQGNLDSKTKLSTLDDLHSTEEQRERQYPKTEGTTHPKEPLTPPRSERDLPTVLTQGGIPWYLECFSPSGITVYDESYDGLKVRREMSEELSEMDEEELLGLGLGMDAKAQAHELQPELEPEQEATPGLVTSKKTPARKRKKFRGFY